MLGGLALMERMLGYEWVILIDALYKPEEKPGNGYHSSSSSGGKPGTIHRMTLEDLRNISPTQHSSSTHDTSLVIALELGERIGLSLPEKVIIYAIEAENIIDFGEEPTPVVSQAIPKVTAAILEELKTAET